MQPVSASDFIDCVLAFDGLERDLSFELSGVPLSPCLHRFLPPTRQPFYTLRGCPNFGVHYTIPFGVTLDANELFDGYRINDSRYIRRSVCVYRPRSD